MLDLKIVGGTIVDGSGQPGFIGDVGVRDGRIVAMGEVADEARETVDASGKIVSRALSTSIPIMMRRSSGIRR